MYKYFTSESVASGHPDKICDQVSDAIVDMALDTYPKSRVAVETLVTKNQVVIAGEVTSPKKIDFRGVAQNTIRKLGYVDNIFEFSDKSPILVFVHEQSPDIAFGVDDGGAGDQGMMFGFAVNETEELMPLPIIIAHRLSERMDEVRNTKILPYLRPDGKSEVKVLYEGGIPKSVEKVVLAVPHDPKIGNQRLKSDLYKNVVTPVLKKYGYKVDKQDLVVNGTGKWTIGGPASDTGVTGRKIIVDTYGGYARHGGGCFSGKDPTKVDRSAAYAARFLAKNIVAKKFAEKCEVQLAYVIGRKEPITKSIETFGTEHISLERIEKFAWDILDLSVLGIINGLNLRRPIYENSAVYGHFGRNSFPWEKIIS